MKVFSCFLLETPAFVRILLAFYPASQLFSPLFFFDDADWTVVLTHSIRCSFIYLLGFSFSMPISFFFLHKTKKKQSDKKSRSIRFECECAHLPHQENAWRAMKWDRPKCGPCMRHREEDRFYECYLLCVRKRNETNCKIKSKNLFCLVKTRPYFLIVVVAFSSAVAAVGNTYIYLYIFSLQADGSSSPPSLSLARYYSVRSFFWTQPNICEQQHY